ncbi:tryptophan--tRNA ligase [Massilia sp. W12]|uniref:tryptophan--tRNA ligase n=1 Tax=Massilia sp. W12 TaxID=3126507 RepID=UPI0030D430C4
MKRHVTLTGITPSGTPHLGNYLGAMRPAIEKTRTDANSEFFYFLADYHSLIKSQDFDRIRQSSIEVAASWLAAGLDPEQVKIYRQSDLIETAELNWILSCVAPKGLLNRAHAYKAIRDDNVENGRDEDFNVTMGLYCYPVLMTADIILFDAKYVPVGADQVQHLEIARDIVGSFNYRYGETFVLPEALVGDGKLLTGLDGRKMSKSYNNAIELYCPEKQLKKDIMKIKTNSQLPGEPKNPDESILFEYFAAFGQPDEVANMRQAFLDGIGWGDAKEKLFQLVNRELAPEREKYQYYISHPGEIEDILLAGADKVKPLAKAKMEEVRNKVGIRAFR